VKINNLEFIPLSQGELVEVNGGSEAAFNAGVEIGESSQNSYILALYCLCYNKLHRGMFEILKHPFLNFFKND
jgi:hypothetical protein